MRRNKHTPTASLRSIDIILSEADEATELGDLIKAYAEIFNSKKSYLIRELYFAKEHLEGLAREMAISDLARGNPLISLLVDLENLKG